MGKRKQIEREAPKEEEIENMASVGAVNEHEKKHDEVDREYFDKLPPGFRFKPTGEELIVHYLKKKVSNLPLPNNRIRDVNLYNFHPRQLANMYKLHREREWYFFTPRDKKYPNGSRPDRSAGNGYWKATGADTKIFSNGIKVGSKKSLVYYEGKAKDKSGKKTEWIMHEYRISTEEENDNTKGVGPVRRAPNDMKLDDWVLCTMYKKDNLPTEQERGNEPNDLLEAENNTAIDVQVLPNPEAGPHGERVNNIVNVPVLHGQVPSQNKVQWRYFNNSASVPVVNYGQVFNPTPTQQLPFNHGYTRFSQPSSVVFNYNQQLGPGNTLPCHPHNFPNNGPVLSVQWPYNVPKILGEPVEIWDYPPPLNYIENPVSQLDMVPSPSLPNNLGEPVEILDYPATLDY